MRGKKRGSQREKMGKDEGEGSFLFAELLRGKAKKRRVSSLPVPEQAAVASHPHRELL